MKYYTGIGSRDTPPDVLERLSKTSYELGRMGYVLRSGGADGADRFCEMGADLSCGMREIYLPHENFNNHYSPLYLKDMPHAVVKLAEEFAARIHPKWEACSPFAKSAHTRNVFQILGKDLETPSDFVICYTSDGTAKGGTATAINLAEKHGIPVYNFFNDNIEKFIEFL